MKIAIYPATFDPITNGHIDIAERAALLFDQLIVGVYDRPLKNLLFSIEERLEMTRTALAHLENVGIRSYSGLTVNFAREENAGYIVRGLRALSDFEWELQLSLANHSLDPHIETVCLMASQEHSFLSSSILKEVALNNGSIEHLAPPIVVAALYEKARFDENGDSPIRTVSVRD
jgi:pantetheine-phosphate adenylyltransferase